jgi:hypothetical protein
MLILMTAMINNCHGDARSGCGGGHSGRNEGCRRRNECRRRWNEGGRGRNQDTRRWNEGGRVWNEDRRY